MDAFISEVINGQDFPRTFMVFTGACLSNVFKNISLKMVSFSSTLSILG
jgi:hypothetical protein